MASHDAFQALLQEIEHLSQELMTLLGQLQSLSLFREAEGVQKLTARCMQLWLLRGQLLNEADAAYQAQQPQWTQEERQQCEAQVKHIGVLHRQLGEWLQGYRSELVQQQQAGSRKLQQVQAYTQPSTEASSLGSEA